MKVLNKEELKLAEKSLNRYFPQSLQAYGFVFLNNRIDADPIDVLVDHWPDFNVLIAQPIQEKESDLYKGMCIFTKDDIYLKSILFGADFFDWKQYHCLSFDLCYVETIKAAAAKRGVSETMLSVCHMMALQDPSKLPDDRLSIEVSSLEESHVALVNSTWKFGSGEYSKGMIRNMIKNYPSCCVMDSNQPVAWILTYPYCAMGMLYTLPEHRGKGYAKTLITIMAKKLYSDGWPVYCFIEEENKLSYRLFANLGFTEDPDYRVAWYSFNQEVLSAQ